MELLKQDLATEPDLQNFIGFALEGVRRLGGDVFAASLSVLNLMQRLRSGGAATGRPMPASLVLDGHELLVFWGENNSAKAANFAALPDQDIVEQLRQHLQNSTALIDPDILLQRNAQMQRHLDEIRARTEREIEALQQAVERRQDELRESMRQAETDPLTGLLNRRAFDDRLGRAFHHTMRQRNAPLSLALFDLDHFKEINDEHGHQFGDAHLNRMARVLRGIIRENVDFAFRFGGDEFAAVIFADYPLACDKARQVLLEMDGKVSIGITAINPETPDSLTLEEYFRRADRALYQAKNQGRGRAVVDMCHMPNNSSCLAPCAGKTVWANG